MDEEAIELTPVETDEDPTPVGDPTAPTIGTPVNLDDPEESDPQVTNTPPLHEEQGSHLGLDEEDDELPPDLYDGDLPPEPEDWDAIPESPGAHDGEDPENEDQELAQLTAASFTTEDLGPIATTNGITHYEVQARTHGGEQWELIARVEPSEDMLEVSDLPVGETWSFRIRAVFANGTTSAWSAPSPVIFPEDMIAPGIPSKPTVAGHIAGISVSWDGLTNDGKPMPADFSHVIIWDSPSGDPGTFERRASMAGAGESLLTGYEVNEPWFFALTAMDTSGNESGMSTYASSSRESVVDLTDLRDKLASLEQTDIDLSEAQQQAIDDLHELNDKLDNLEEFDTSDLEDALANLQQELSTVAEGVGPGFQELRDALEAIETPDLSHLATQGDVTAAQAAAEAAARTHAELVASGAKSEAIAAAQAAAQAAQAAAEATANAYADAQRQAAINSAAQDAQARADTALANAEQSIERAIALSGNMVPNPSFEEGAKGWTLPNDGRISQSTVAYHGDRVLRMDTTGSLVSTQSAHRVPVTAGERYRLSVNVRAQSTQVTDGYVYIVAVRHRPDGTSSVQTVARLGADHSDIKLPWSNQWQTLSGDITIPDGFTAISFGIRVHNTATTGYYVDFDMASMANITPAKEALDAAAAAQSAAQAAHNAAGTAQSNAQSALTMAGSKSKVTYSTSAPSGTASVGDTHRQRNSSGDIIGEWEYTSSGWRKREISSESISNLDVGKLTAGSIVTPEATIKKLLADGITANTIVTARSIVASPNILPDSLTDGHDDFYSQTGVGFNSTHPSVWVRGRLTVTSPGSVQLVAGTPYHFSVDVSAATQGTRYYIDLVKADSTSEYVRVASSELAGNTSTTFRSHSADFTVNQTAKYKVKIWANHTSGSPNESYQWFRGLSIRVRGQGELIVDGSIKTKSLDAEEVAAGLGSFMKIEVEDLIATKGQLGSAVVNRLFSDIFATNKLTASQITVAPGNLWGDPNFDGQIVANWTKTTWGGVPAITGPGTGSQTGGYSAVNAIDVLPGDEIYVSAVMGAAGSGDMGEARVYGRMVTPDGTASSISMICSQTTGTTATRFGTYKVPDSIPAGSKFQLGFFRQGTTPSTRRWYIREVKAWRKAQATTIANGVIKVAHIENTGDIVSNGLYADIIKGEHIDGNTFSGNTFVGGLFRGGVFEVTNGGQIRTSTSASRGIKLSTASGLEGYNTSGVRKVHIHPTTGIANFTDSIITGGRIQTSATASQGIKLSTASGLEGYNASGVRKVHINPTTGNANFTDSTITGGRVQTSATANRGVKMTSDGLRGYNSSGTQTFYLNGSTGALTASGRFTSTGAGTSYARMDANVYAGRPGLQLHTGYTHGLQPSLFAMGSTSNNGYAPSTVVLHSTEATINSTGRAEVILGNRGTRAALRYMWGPLSGHGFDMEGDRLKLTGRLSGYGKSDSMIYPFETSGVAGSHSGAVYYDAPSSTSNFNVFGTARMAVSGGEAGWGAIISVYNVGPGSVRYTSNNATGSLGTHGVQLLRVRS